jgi:hypothetical protein
MSTEALVKAAAEQLGAEVQNEGDSFNVTVSVAVEGGEPYSELVVLYETEGAVLVRNTFGYNDGSTDLNEVLRLLAQTRYSRVYLEADEAAEESEYFVIEAAVPAGVPAAGLASVIREVADWSGSFRSILPEEPAEEG